MAMPPGVLTITSKGQDILETNFWSGEVAESGRVFFSCSSGCIRLLLPDNQIHLLPEIETGKEVIISRGPCSEFDLQDAFEILFEDYSSNPFSIQMTIEGFDMVPEEDQRWKFSAWTRAGKFYTAKRVRYRLVKEIPYLKPWGK